MTRTILAALAAFVSLTCAQQVGTPETHPKIMAQKCSKKNGCINKPRALVIDSLNHWIHYKNGTNCNAQSNGADCIIDGISDYSQSGVTTNGSSMNLQMYLNKSGQVNVPVSPRVYLLGEDEKEYQYFKLLNQEISFDADVSNLPCGMNGALYLTSMPKNGGKSKINKAGAAYGTGYCDAQCPKATFISGVPNANNSGACCAEMDLWEANVAATQLTPHPCTVEGLYECSGTDCLNSDKGGVCDEYGCGFNPYKGNEDYFKVGGVVDTSKPFTVTTQFFTTKGKNQTLNEIRRVYTQNGKTIANDFIPYGNAQTTDSLTPGYCNATASTYEAAGAFEQMSTNLKDGMVLIFSIWNDNGGNMTWLDTGSSGPCNAIESGPSVIVQEDPTTNVVFSNIRWGDINSTYGAYVKMDTNAADLAAPDTSDD